MNIIIVGRGGFSYVVEEELRKLGNYKVIGYMDSCYQVSQKINDIYYLKMFDTAFVKEEVSYHIAIGNNSVRKDIYYHNCFEDKQFISIVSSNAWVSESVELGEGSFIGPGAIVNANTYIGKHTIINTNATVEHNCNIGDFCLINTSSILYSNINLIDETTIKVGEVLVKKQPS